MTSPISTAARRTKCWLLALVACLTAGCSERPASLAATAAPADLSAPAASPAPATSPGSAPPPRMAMGRVLVITPPESALAPVEPVLREPTAHYASLEAARDAVEAMLRHAVPAGDTAVHFSRERVKFEYIWAKATARGLAVHVLVNDTTTCPHERLMESMRAAGWVDDWNYSADGDDGTRMGLVCRQFQCVVEGSWVGWDPTDPTYIPPPGCQVTATCVPRRLDDVPGN